MGRAGITCDVSGDERFVASAGEWCTHMDTWTEVGALVVL